MAEEVIHGLIELKDGNLNLIRRGTNGNVKRSKGESTG
jgi:hypothetical protein